MPHRLAAPLSIRPAVDDDAAALIALIGSCFAEYPGCILDVDRELPELRNIASHFAARRGRFWVAEQAGDVVACVGCRPLMDESRADESRGGGIGGPSYELHKLYVARAARRRGVAGHLVGLAEAEAEVRGAGCMELWTDSRFVDAHRLYDRLGYARLPEVRALDDLSASTEYRYRKLLRPRG